MADYLRGFTLFRENTTDVYCAAYGSNLVERRMKERCPGSSVYGTSEIHGYRLLFKQSMTGAYATIEQDANSKVPVVIYKMSMADEAKLDRFEGTPRYYRKQEFLLTVWNVNGKKRKKRRYCIAYIMREDRPLGKPSKDYFKLLDEGYGRWGFDYECLFKGLDSSIGFDESKAWLERFYGEVDRHE